jgi:1,4-dihydroxy-6-naphthoate synthase
LAPQPAVRLGTQRTPVNAPASLTLAYSPSVTDTYLYAAWSNGLLAHAPAVSTTIDYLEALNTAAFAARYAVSRASYPVAPLVAEEYRVMRSGSTLVSGRGPLLVGRSDKAGGLPTIQSLRKDARVAVPGTNTTAYLLLSLALGWEPAVTVMRHDRVIGAVARGEADMGIVIDEARIGFAAAGLVCVSDLTEWWLRETGYPCPLVCTLVRRDLPLETARAVGDAIRASLAFAQAHELRIAPFVRGYSPETDPGALYVHLRDCVNAYTRDIGDDGEAAAAELFSRASRAGLIPDGPRLEFL